MRPHVICHMMTPLDGELVVADWGRSSGRDPQNLVDEYERIHGELGADAWISGRSVGEEFAVGQPHAPATFDTPVRPIHVARQGAKEYAVLIDLHGKLHWTSPEVQGGAVVVILGPDVPDSHLAELAGDGISYVVVQAPLNVAALLDTLADTFGIKRLLLEGGAKTNAAFFSEKLVDEISLVIFPAIGGHSGAPTIFDAGDEGLADKVILGTLTSETRDCGGVHIRYSVAYREGA